MMAVFSSVPWHRVLVPDMPLLEIVVRGTLVYLALFTLLRVMLKRQQAGAVGVTDLLVIVLIADAAQNAMAGDYQSVPDGVLLVAVIIGWSYVLDWLGYHVPWVQRFVHPPPLPFIQEGRMLRRNMREELVTPEELLSQLRQQGIAEIAEVKVAYMEGDGHISVVKYSGEQQKARARAGG